jgi:hypothetical protein
LRKGPSGGIVSPAQITGTVTWTKAKDDKDKVILGVYNSTDITFGHFPTVWSDDEVVLPRIVDACGQITIQGGDQYGDTYTYKVSNISGASMTIVWENTFKDGGTVVLTRKDGKNWPTNLR